MSILKKFSEHEEEPLSNPDPPFLTLNMGTKKGKKCCRRLTSVASLVHHQHIGANANYPTDITLELPVGQPDTAGRREGLGFGARL